MHDPNKSLSANVRSWLESEGYPLEFRVARAFEERGFDSNQGHYVAHDPERPAREIDVLANKTIRLENNGFFRISHVVECKWSRDKPWVIFTNRNSIMAESACIAQTVGSTLGEAVAYCLAGESGLYQLKIFERPERGGFSGRRVFEKQDRDAYDQFYRTIQGLVDATVAEACSYNHPSLRKATYPTVG